MPARHRTLDERPPESGSSYWYITGTTYRSYANGVQRECWDVVGNRGAVNPFESHTKTTIRGTLTGEQYGGPGGSTLLRKLEKYPFDRVATAIDPRTVFGSLSPGDVQNCLRTLLAQSSPNTPSTSVPTFIGELKDLPSLARYGSEFASTFVRAMKLPPLKQLRYLPTLVKLWGKRILALISEGYISWRWAIRPLYKDLRNLYQFVDIVEKRRRQLQRMSEGAGHRARTSISSDLIETSKVRTSVHSSTGTPVMYADVWTKYRQDIWGTARWRTSPSTLPSSRLDLLAKARQYAFGLRTFELLRTAWELTPWSWLADWFGSVGDNLTLVQNQCSAYWFNAAVMRHISSDRVVAIDMATKLPWAAITAIPVEQWEIKERYNDVALWLPTLPTSLPVLDTSKWSILTALAVSKFSRS